MLEACIELAASLQPLPPRVRAGVDLVRSTGGWLRVCGAVDGLHACRAVLEVVSEDGRQTHELASVFVEDLPLGLAP